MQLEKLFKVLVLGGTALAVGCEDTEPPADPAARDQRLEVRGGSALAPDVVRAGTGVVLDAGTKADGGVSSWLHWF